MSGADGRLGIPFLIALGELLFIVLLAVGGVVGRVLFRRPWTVDAVSPSSLAIAAAVPTSDEVAAAVFTG